VLRLEDQIVQKSREIKQVNKELEMLQSELSARVTELAASTSADAANASVQTIVDAPSAGGCSPEWWRFVDRLEG
jgi:hypothetical protein